MDVHADQKILDVAAGNGNFTLAAARRWADITSTDYVHSLLERGRQRAVADGFDLTFELADAGKVISLTGATGKTFTVPPNVDVAFLLGTFIGIVKDGT